jgi:hypothetical protein
MKRILMLTALGLILCRTAAPEDESLTLLTEAAHCMISNGRQAHKVLHGNPKLLNIGYFTDPKSYPGERALYIVNYQASNFSKGMVFVYFIRESKGMRTYRFENNATFVHKKKEIEFTEPPIGGAWTTEQIDAAIDRAERQAKVELYVKDLRGPFPGVRCESYADPQ